MKESPVDSETPPDGPVGAKGDAPPPPPPAGPPGGRGMPKMGQDGCPEPPPSAVKRAAGFMMIAPGGACLVDIAQTMAGFAEQLGNLFDHPVTDMTGLT